MICGRIADKFLAMPAATCSADMAQSAVTVTSSSGVSFTAQELCEILEYERIVQFRDSVLSGTHPRVKISVQRDNPLALSNSSSLNENAPLANVNKPTEVSNLARSSNVAETLSHNRTPNNHGNSDSRLAISTESEINPVLLEKSEDLIKAEIQLQRQRLERALKDQVELQRVTTKALLRTSESLPDFDVAEALSKAHAIVQPSPAAVDEPSAGAPSGSDSLDDNTFYSSQHDTPDPPSPSSGHKKYDVRTTQPAQIIEHHSTETLSKTPNNAIHAGSSQLSKNNLAAQNHTKIPPFTSNPKAQEKELDLGLSDSSTPLEEALREENFTRMNRQNPTALKNVVSKKGTHPLTDQSSNVMHLQENSPSLGFQNGSTSTITRSNNNNISPIASQPARVSPSINAGCNIVPYTSAAEERQLVPTTAKRHLRRISSTESSPIGTNSERKKEKKNKRNAKDGSISDSPYIKPEPQSPSSFVSMARPLKRQRGQYASDVNYDERQPRLDLPAQERIADPYHPAWRRRSYERDSHVVSLDYEPRPRWIEGDNAYRRVGNGHYGRHPHSPQFVTPYAAGEVRSRAASTVMGRRPHEEGRLYRESIARASVRPDVDFDRSRSPLRENIPMGPPRQPLRIIIDENEHQQYDHTPTSIRHSVAPMIRCREDELVYERIPSRAVSARMPLKVYDEDGLISRRGSPTLTASRRVVTQSEYLPGPPVPHTYRDREYSVRPSDMTQYFNELVPFRVATESRPISHFDEPTSDYWRATTVRPEPIRYGAPVEYAGRMQSVRPEVSLQEPGLRREVATQAQREYSVRPVENASQREILPESRYYEEIPASRMVAHGAGEYYNEPSTRRPVDMVATEEIPYEERYRRRPADVEYMEEARVREPSVILYADDGRREVYR